MPVSHSPTAVLHGLGRFGLHWLRAWLDRADSGVRLLAIQDSHHGLDSALRLLREDAKPSFADWSIRAEAGCLCFHKPGRNALQVAYWHGPAQQSPWLGQADWWLECSGAFASGAASRPFLRGRTRRVIVSATCPGADQTLVFGHNDRDFDPAAGILSYGSCTVNAFVPLAAWLHGQYGVTDAGVSVIHNVPAHQLASHAHPQRRTCTLETEGPRMLPFLAPDRLRVDYVLIPYTGVSLIDFRFDLTRAPSEATLLDALAQACAAGPLQGLYALEPHDTEPQSLSLRPESAVLLRPRAGVRRGRLFLPACFDNENSAVRYLDLLESLVRQRA